MSSRQPASSQRKWLGLHPEWWILVLCLALTGATVRYVRNEDMRTNKMRIQRRAEIVMTDFSGRFANQTDALASLQSVFNFSDPASISEARFNAMADDLKRRQPNLWALQFGVKVLEKDKAAFLSKLGAQGRPMGNFTRRAPAGDALLADIPRQVYYPIVFSHPSRPQEINFVGFDLLGGTMSDLLRPASLSGTIQLSPAITLIRDFKTGIANGYAEVAAIFEGTPQGLTPAQRLEATRGYLVAVYFIDDVFGSLTQELRDNNLDLMVTDRTDYSNLTPMYYRAIDGSAFPGRDEFNRSGTTVSMLSFGGRNLEFKFRNGLGHNGTTTSREAYIFLFSGILLSLGAFAFVRMSRRHDLEIKREVAERTRELEESRAQLADVMKSLPGVAYRCFYDERLTVAFVSNGAEALTGHTAEQLLSGEVHFRDIVHPDDLARVREATRQAVETDKAFEIEYRIRTKSGAEKWVLSRGHAVKAGSVQYIEGLVTDITFQKVAESERLAIERKLLDGQKLESLGLLAGGVAHDFNNLLTVIVGSAELAKLSIAEGGTLGIEEQLTQIDSTAQRAAELCRQMLAYAGQGRFEIAPIDVGSVVQDMQPLFNISVHRRTHLALSLAPNLPAVMADKTQLRQIVMNLVINASDAIEGRDGEISVTTGLMSANREYLEACIVGAGLSPGVYVYLEVTDTGSGMSAEVMKKIFDPFFTTKFAGRGLGLAAVLGIVRGHGGGLRVSSTVGHGSVFRLILPPAGTQAKAPDPVAASSRWTGKGRILLADDEDPVRKVTTRILETFGFAVDAVGDGAAAVDAFRKDPERYAGVILDLVMPVMSGDEALRAIWELKPQTRVLLISGYNEGDLLTRNPGPMLYLRKPFTRAELEQSMKRLTTEL